LGAGRLPQRPDSRLHLPWHPQDRWARHRAK